MIRLISIIVLLLPNVAKCAEVTPVSTTGSAFKMIFGLALVLGVMALVAWLIKRMVPGVGGQHSTVRIVGGVSVGSRERVVVLEIAGRWLVVGVAPGQVSAIANLEANTSEAQGNIAAEIGADSIQQQLNTPGFAQWLKKSAAKFK